MRQMRRWAMNESDQGPISLGYRLGHIKSDGRIYRALVYNKSASVLHMLRRLIGDDAFFAGLRRFYAASRFRKVGTDEFKAADRNRRRPLARSLLRSVDPWIDAAAAESQLTASTAANWPSTSSSSAKSSTSRSR